MKYCIVCGYYDVIEDGNFHYHDTYTEYGHSAIECYGPFTSSEPPLYPDDYQPSEPMPIELAISDIMAGELLEDFR